MVAVMKKRNLVCIQIGVTRKLSKRTIKGGNGRVLWLVRIHPTHTVTEGPGKPQFKFRGDDIKLGQHFRARTSEWTNTEPFALPTYEVLS